MQKLQGTAGYVMSLASSKSDKVLGKLTDLNHLSTLMEVNPTAYDRGVIKMWSETSPTKSSDFINMINDSTPFEVDEETFYWDISKEAELPKVIEIPTATLNAADDLTTEDTFQIVYDIQYFTANDIIANNLMIGNSYEVISYNGLYGKGHLYTLTLSGEDLLPESPVDIEDFAINTHFEKIDNIVGEFDQELSGLGGFGSKIRLYNSIPAGYGVEHTITKWADHASVSMNAEGNPLDLVIYDQYIGGKLSGSRWEPLIERAMKSEMMKIRTNRYLYGRGGESSMGKVRQESRKITKGVVHLMRDHAHYVPFFRGTFSLNLIRETIGSQFRGKVSMEDRKVTLYTNEAGIKLFKQSNKEDIINSGFTIIADDRFIEGRGQNMMVNYGFDSAFTMETGKINVVHLQELDQPTLNNNFNGSRQASPVFIAFDLSEGEGGLKNVRELRMKNAPSMTWGYIDGRGHHLGFAKSKGMQSATMFPGYQMWMEDRSGVFVEDFSKTIMFEQIDL